MTTLSPEPYFWPALPLDAWKETYDTLHMWTQIVGKVRLTLSPLVNHWWEAALYTSARGLTTSPIFYGLRTFEIEFDFIDHVLWIRTAEGATRTLPLNARPVAEFYREILDHLHSLGIDAQIDPNPKEVPDPIPFDQDLRHAAYDPEFANRFFRVLLQADRLLKRFRGPFLGKCSPVHFFWGSFDLAVTRFSGRLAPPRPGVDSITREAYSHEVISTGFWPGSGNITGPAFYAYAAPEPPGFSSSPIRPAAAFYNPPTKGFVLMYDDVRKAEDRDRLVLDFLESTYSTAADLGGWDRAALERARPLHKAVA